MARAAPGRSPQADLANARLQGVTLADARLQGADLANAQLQRANLEGAQLHGARANRATGWPRGLTRERPAWLSPATKPSPTDTPTNGSLREGVRAAPPPR
ncbi:MAG TPA: pentapeptide repeat-containing protein [Actinomycetes bacterium]|nr:pentapeptide repeat-containing protein [Actinomycetes bacterium]